MSTKVQKANPKRRKKNNLTATTSKILYDAVEINHLHITAEVAKQLIGWECEKKDEDFGTSFLLRNSEGTKVRALFNVNNRPLYKNNVDKLKSEILNGNWQFNGDAPIIIGRTGKILNGQHTLCALILAQEQTDRELKIEKLVVTGVEETDKVVNTIDTSKSRSFRDVLFRSEAFASYKPTIRRILTRHCAYAVKMIRQRMNVNKDVKCSFSEMYAFVEQHPQLVEIADYIYTELPDRFPMPIGLVITSVFFMATSNTDPEEYNGSNLNWSNFDKAKSYIVSRYCRKLISNAGGLQTREDMLAQLAAGWPYWLAGNRESPHVLYKEIDGLPMLVNSIDFGGIDRVYEK